MSEQSVGPAHTDSDDQAPIGASFEAVPEMRLVPSTVTAPTDREILISLSQKVDYLHGQNVSILNGLEAVYSGVGQILQLLAGVQQVAAMMPGKIGKAVREMASSPNGEQR